MRKGIITFLKNISFSCVTLLILLLICEAGYRGYEFYFYERQLRKFDKDLLKPLPNEPILQYKMIPSSDFFWHGKIHYKINSYGLRDYEYDLNKNDGYRIVVLGDSYAFGWGVDMADTFPKILESALKKKGYDVQVINAAVYGYNTQQEVLYFKKEILGRYKPDLVIISYVLNDTRVQGTVPIHPFVKNFESNFHLWFVEFLKLRLNRLINKRSSSETDWKSGDFYPIKVKIANPYLPNEEAFGDNFLGWKRCKEALEEIKGLSEEKGFALYLIILPAFNESFRDYTKYSWIHDKVKRYAQDIGIKVSDFYRYFKDMDNKRLQNVKIADDHPNELAHRIIAEKLASELENENIIRNTKK